MIQVIRRSSKRLGAVRTVAVWVTLLALLASLVGVFAMSRPAGAADFSTATEFKLTASDGAAADYFGESVAIDGDTLVVGAYGDDGQGSAYIFARSGTAWMLQAKLTASDGAAGDNFGGSVAIDGDTVVVGAGGDDGQGSAYVFTRSGTAWLEQAKLSASDGAAGDGFGGSVAIDGDTVVVGASGDDVGSNTNQGSAYVFTRSGTSWSEQQKLTASDGAAGDWFGVEVAISGDTAVVGAWDDEVGSNLYQGSAYVFTRSDIAWSTMASGTTDHLRDVWGSSSSNVFAVGDSGTILRYNGSAWSAMTSGTTNHLRDVWGSSSSNVFAVGDSGTILRYNGSTWSAMTSGTTDHLRGVWGSSSSDVFAVGDDGTILRYNGSAWSPMTSGTTSPLYGVWGSSSSDVFAVGLLGFILHYNGSAWSTMTSGTMNLLLGVWGSSSSDVFAVGQGGIILRYDGSAWSAMTSGTTDYLCGVWASSSSDVFAVGQNGAILRYNGSAWSAMTSGTTSYLRGVRGSSSSDVFAVGDDGTIQRYTGATWSEQQKLTASDGAAGDYFGKSVDIDGDTAVVGAFGDDDGQGSAYVFTRSDTSWSEQQKLTASDGADGDYFGWSVAISGDTVVASASQDDVGTNTDQGSAYVFVRSGTSWSEQIQGFASDGTAYDYFGVSVAIDGHTAVAGAAYDDIGVNPNQGSAYVYEGTEGGGAQVAATFTLQSISITVSIPEGYPTAVDYGLLSPNAEAVPVSYTPGTYQYLRVQNNGNVAEDFFIKGADATCGLGTLTLAATPGADQYSHLYGMGETPTDYSVMSTLGESLGANVPVNGTVDFNLKLRSPTSFTVNGQYSTTVTIVAVAYEE